MGTRDPRIDSYIENSASFAQPILTRIREIVHQACPDVEETMKWSFPHFMYHGMLCSMASFKAHCAFGFWKGSLIVDAPGKNAMGQFGRITSVKELPTKKDMTAFIKQAMQLNRDGVKVEKMSKAKKKPAKAASVPADLAAALERSRKALDTFDAFPPSQRKEYIEWVTEAKREDTRRRRIEQAIALLEEGKTRHWKYQPG